MGQKEVMEMLKSEKGKFFSCDDVSQRLNITFNTAFTSLKKLGDQGVVTTKNGISSSGGKVKKLYSYFVVDKELNKIHDEYIVLREQTRYKHLSGEYLVLLMILKELRRL